MKTGILIVLISGLFFGFVPSSHAQSIQNWSKPVNLSNSGAASNPSMVIDNDGIIYIVWVDTFDGYKFSKSMDDGVSWTFPTTVKFPFSTKTLPPVLFSDAKGSIHIFWLSDKNELFYAQTVAGNLDSPAAWRMTKLDAPVYDFDVRLDSQGGLHLGYVKNPAPNPGTAGIFYRHSVDGSSWSTALLLYESPYFRSMTLDEARIRLAVSNNLDGEAVFAVWDDRPQKRIFMARSADSGSTWSPAQEIIIPEADSGFRTPYHADVAVLENKLLVTWNVGEPGIQCTPYSWTSTDSGKTWDAPIRIFAESTVCPESSEFINLDPAYSTILFTVQGTLSLSAWNGQQWSNPEAQTGPSSITNPLTFDTVVLGCEQTAISKNKLYVVGCDQGKGGDVWFIARQLDPLNNLFPLPSAWGGDTNVATIKGVISSLSSIPDDAGNIHAFWIQSSGTSTDPIEPTIMYSRWNGKEWTNPAPIITTLSGSPINLTIQFDDHRLLLSWVNQQTGDLLFTWANSERAHIPSEWLQPVILSASSPLTNSPTILVDALHRIIVAYAISLNEGRGIYVVQSTDLGATWSTPVRVFDAASANWQMVDQPRLAVTEAGKLHIIFTEYTLVGGQESAGLYYSQSVDGGNTWTTPDVISDQPVQWSKIVAYQNRLHLVWQEKNNSINSTYYQESMDDGVTWSPPTKIPDISSEVSIPADSLDWTGKIHILRIIRKDTVNLQEWGRNDKQHLQLLTTRQFNLPKAVSVTEVESGISSQGTMYALLQFEKKPNDGDEIETSLLNIARSLDLPKPSQPFVASMSTPAIASLPTTPVRQSQPTPTPIAALANAADTKPSITKNIIGLVLIISVMILLLIFIIPKKGSSRSKTK